MHLSILIDTSNFRIHVFDINILCLVFIIRYLVCRADNIIDKLAYLPHKDRLTRERVVESDKDNGFPVDTVESQLSGRLSNRACSYKAGHVSIFDFHFLIFTHYFSTKLGDLGLVDFHLLKNLSKSNPSIISDTLRNLSLDSVACKSDVLGQGVDLLWR